MTCTRRRPHLLHLIRLAKDGTAMTMDVTLRRLQTKQGYDRYPLIVEAIQRTTPLTRLATKEKRPLEQRSLGIIF